MIGHFPDGNRNWFFLYSAKNIVMIGLAGVFLGLLFLAYGLAFVIWIISLIVHGISSMV